MPANKPVRPTEDIKRRFAAGEPLTSKGVAEDYGCSTALLHATMSKMRKDDGVAFIEELIPGQPGSPKRFTQATPRPTTQATTWGPAAGVKKLGKGRPSKAEKIRAKDRERKQAIRDARKAELEPASRAAAWAGDVRKAKAVVKSAHRNGTSLHHPVPALGDKVEVYLLMLDDDGRVNVGLRSPDAAWLVGVDGFSARVH